MAAADVSASLGALAAEYDSWVAERDDGGLADGLSLYVREMRAGSLVTDLVALAPYAVPLAFPFIENATTVIEFAKHLAAGYDALLKGEPDTETVPRHTYENLSAVLEPVAKDNASQMNLSTTVHGDVHIHFHATSMQANAAQNTARRALAAAKIPLSGLREKVVLYLHQARNDPKSKAGDRAIVESIHAGPVKVIFSTDRLKAEMVSGAENPFRSTFLVDVEVETVRGKPVLYKVLRVHETLEKAPDSTEAA